MTEKIEEILIEIALKIAKQKKGCLFVIMKNKFDYAHLLGNDIKTFSIFDNRRRLELLASMDGACIVNPSGMLIDYAVNILNVKNYNGFGTRHCASYTASQNGNIAIMSSEEDMKVRIFKDNKMVMQIDPFERGEIKNKAQEAVGILESIGVGTVSTLGITLLAPTIGITLIPGIIVFGSAHFVAKAVSNWRRT